MRYKETVVGAGWAIFQLALMAFVYVVVFGRFARFPSGNIHYALFIVGGLLPWQYFSSSVTSGAASLVSSVNLVTKVYFPRLLLPLATVFVPVLDFLLGLVVLVAMMAWFDTWPPGAQVLLAPAFLLLGVVSAIGFTLLLSAASVRYRDVPYAIPVFLQVGPLVSGVPYDVSGLPEKWQTILAFNPMTTVVAGWRWAVLGCAAARDRRRRRRRGRRRRGAGRRARLLPFQRAPLRRHDLMAAAPAIVARDLAKRYRIGELQASYGTLRESLVRAVRHVGRGGPSRGRATPRCGRSTASRSSSRRVRCSA